MLGLFGVMGANADALAAIDAAVGYNGRLARTHADSLGGAALDAVGASNAGCGIQIHRMKIRRDTHLTLTRVVLYYIVFLQL